MTILAVSALALAAWLYLFFGRGFFWRATARLPAGDVPLARWPRVVAVVPARDEADVIGRAAASLVGQDYPGAFSIIVVDDGSLDGTGDAARQTGGGARVALEVLRGAPRPTGWTGKVWAMEQGYRRATETAPDAGYVWFTDADIVHPRDALRRLAAQAEAERLDLVSLMARLHCETAWERLLIPAFVFFFQKLYPFPWVNRPATRMAGAAGGSMLVRRTALDRIGGPAAIRNDLIDDCALARAIKPHGPIWLGLCESARSIRPYGGLGGIWSMVARTAFHQLRYSPMLLAGTLIGMMLIYLAPPLTLLGWPLHADALAAGFGAASVALMSFAYLPTLRLYGRPAPAALLLPVAALLYAAMTLDSALRHWRGKGGAWKARYHRPGEESLG